MAHASGDKSQTDKGSAPMFGDIARQFEDSRKLIIAANRGPLSFTEAHAGELIPRPDWTRGYEQFEPLSNIDISWVTGAISAADRAAADSLSDSDGLVQNDVLPDAWTTRFVSMPRRIHHRFYNVICNPLLWFMLHRSWSPTFTPNIAKDEHDAWERGYKTVNESFAMAVVDLAGDDEIMFLCRDYQLMLVPGIVRSKRPSAAIHQSFETPWPWPSDFEVLPTGWRQELLMSLLASDVISFPSSRDIDAFVACAVSALGDRVHVDVEVPNLLSFGNHPVQLAVSAPAVRSSKFKKITNLETIQRAIDRLDEWNGKHTFITVDRAEPHKNIVRSINAFGELLRRNSELNEQVRFLLFITPGPSHISAYKRLMDEIRRSIRRINDKSNGTNPVQIREDGNFSRAVAALATYDTLVSVPLVDGIGRSVLDGALINSKQGNMILSESSAVADFLANNASLVGFSDTEAMTVAMSDAVSETSAIRSAKSSSIRDAVEKAMTASDNGLPVLEILERLATIASNR
jgi:trehalose 6-phosphate synthase